MKLQKLISTFSDKTELPIELPEIRDALIKMGIQDRIIFCPDKDMNTSKLKGTYVQFRTRDGVYGDYENWSVIVYNGTDALAWQRMICTKELVHVLDDGVERTATLEELNGLLNRLLQSVSTEEFNIFDIMAAKDRLALYQAIPLLFPAAARERALDAITGGRTTVDQVAEIACMPKELIVLALDENWPALVKDLTC